jgi:flagellar protein FlaG
MAEEDISTTGQFTAVTSTDFASPYQAPTDVSRQSANAAPATAVPNVAAGSGSAAAKPASQPSAQEIQAAVDRANANLASSNRVLDFRVDAATGITIAMIRNSQTGAVVQQIPGANIIALARMLADWSPGKHMLLDLIA